MIKQIDAATILARDEDEFEKKVKQTLKGGFHEGKNFTRFVKKKKKIWGLVRGIISVKLMSNYFI